MDRHHFGALQASQASGTNRARAVATQLAQADLDQMRHLRLSIDGEVEIVVRLKCGWIVLGPLGLDKTIDRRVDMGGFDAVLQRFERAKARATRG